MLYSMISLLFTVKICTNERGKVQYELKLYEKHVNYSEHFWSTAVQFIILPETNLGTTKNGRTIGNESSLNEKYKLIIDGCKYNNHHFCSSSKISYFNLRVLQY